MIIIKNCRAISQLKVITAMKKNSPSNTIIKRKKRKHKLRTSLPRRSVRIVMNPIKANRMIKPMGIQRNYTNS